MERCRVLEESLHILASEHHEMEKSLRLSDGGGDGAGAGRVNSDSEDEFQDAEEDAFHSPSFYSIDQDNSRFEDSVSEPAMNTTNTSEVTTRSCYTTGSGSNSSHYGSVQSHIASSDEDKVTSASKNPWGGRHVLPSPMRSRNEISVWNILKHAIGQELSKMTMPVNVNEPLSFLQRLSEYLEFAHLLHLADQCEDVVQRMEYIAAFAVSSVSSNWERLGKPFNPLLGETFELDRRSDRGFRMVCEQVSHRPPISAFHVESTTGWKFHGSIRPKLAFWGKAVNVDPKGTVTLELPSHGEVYTWSNVQCNVHNIIFGTLWVEHCGNMEIINHKTKHRVELHWKAVGWTGGKDAHRVEGHVMDKERTKLRSLYGKWIDAMFAVDVDTWKLHVKSTTGASVSTHLSQHSSTNGGLSEDLTMTSTNTTASTRRFDDSAIGASTSTGMFCSMDSATTETTSSIHEPVGECAYTTGSDVDLRLPGQRCLWQSSQRPPHSSQYYNFTYFAMQLNEMPPSSESDNPENGGRGTTDEGKLTLNMLCPTDCRLRPDMRSLEEGRIEDAKNEKNRLEEKQRGWRRDRQKSNTEWVPLWFKSAPNPWNKKDDYLFDDSYWRREWTRCPDIF